MKNFRNILYVTEPALDQRSAIARAVTLAERNLAALTLIDVSPLTADSALLEHRRASLASLAEPHRHRLTINLEVRTGTVFLEVIRAVLRHGYDLVIKAAENPDFLKRLFGSDDMHLLRKCPCPLWLMRTPEKAKYDCIVAAVDLDPLRPAAEQKLDRDILEFAGSLALSENATLHLVHAWAAFAEGALMARSEGMTNAVTTHVEQEFLSRQKLLFALGERLRQQLGAEAYNRLLPRFHLPKGSPQKMLPVVAEEVHADLVVMGTVVRTGIAGFIIGNTAEAVLDQLACSVLAIKPAGFSTPVQLTEP